MDIKIDSSSEEMSFSSDSSIEQTQTNQVTARVFFMEKQLRNIFFLFNCFISYYRCSCFLNSSRSKSR